jgi:hypothetical protein
MIDAFLFSFFNVALLLVWFQTNAFVEYGRYIPFIKRIINSYEKSLSAGINGTFINFLSLNYNSFFIRLVSCPYCLNFWLTLPYLYFFNIKYLAFIYIISLIIYKILNILSKYESR